MHVLLNVVRLDACMHACTTCELPLSLLSVFRLLAALWLHVVVVVAEAYVLVVCRRSLRSESVDWIGTEHVSASPCPPLVIMQQLLLNKDSRTARMRCVSTAPT